MRSIIDVYFVQKVSEVSVIGRGGEIENRKIRKAKGGHDIGLDENGEFIMGRWQPKSDPKTTPLQRLRDPWPSGLKRYVVYKRGLASAWRSRQFAMFEAWRKRIPAFEKLKELFERELRIQIKRREKLSPKIMARLWKAGYLFLKVQKPGLREAKTKIVFLYRDLQGDINIGSALAVATAISARLREELDGTYGWVAVYSGQSSFLNAIQKAVDRSFDKVEHALKTMRRHSFFTEQFLPESQVEPLMVAIRILEKEVENLLPIKPYREWAEFVKMDLNALNQAVRLRRFDEGAHFLQTILVSFEMKRQQRFMDKFLLNLGKAQILNVWKDIFVHWLERLIDTFTKLQPEEGAVFQEPVCEKFISKLLEAKEVLKNGSSIAAFAKPLKEAYLFL